MVIILTTGITTMTLTTIHIATEIAAINKIVTTATTATTATLATILHQNLVSPEGRRDQQGILHTAVGIRDKSEKISLQCWKRK